MQRNIGGVAVYLGCGWVPGLEFAGKNLGAALRHPAYSAPNQKGACKRPLGKNIYFILTIQPKGSACFPHWMPVRLSYSFCVNAPISLLFTVTFCAP